MQPEKESYIPGQLDDLYLSSMIQKILGGFDLPKSCEIRLLFRCKDKSCLVLDVEVGANAQSLTDLVSELQSDPDIVRLLLAFLGQAERTLRIEVQVVTDPDGTIDRQQSVFRIEAE